MTVGLACDPDGYDLRVAPCPRCGSRGCGWECDVPLREPARSRRAMRVPNRLSGAYVKPDGDVI